VIRKQTNYHRLACWYEQYDGDVVLKQQLLLCCC
jgi:hypothetical protein